MKRLFQWTLAVLGALLAYRTSAYSSSMLGLSSLKGSSYAIMGAGAIIFYFVGHWLFQGLREIWKKGEDKLERTPLSHLMAGLAGMAAGLIIAVLLYPALVRLNDGGWLSLAVAGGLGYTGYMIGYRKKEELKTLVMRRGEKKRDEPAQKTCKILDTSVIIDGRIADICKTGFIEGTLIIPEFVLEELQHIADSSDLLKRNRGRRGLDILNKIQKELDVEVTVYEGDFEDISEVDTKLVKLAKLLQGKVITNDFNLNKVCELQGVPVLNINDLANAVKPVVLPGEEIWVQVIKDGKEHGQGVAYLDDGTMIVVEGGGDFIGRTIEVLVTSVLQTSAGRMIFAKPKLLEKAL